MVEEFGVCSLASLDVVGTGGIRGMVEVCHWALHHLQA